ncbi:MAG TPA: bifunctional phosphopantothenoylcysteine decarboxylase/phosphopantothenate--cysteine ligase CoaBC, partial [Thermoanaerobaculia bacterium]
MARGEDARVLVGITGGIAAYKAIEVVRRLRARGAEVRCALTKSAASFVAPLPLEVLSGHAVYREEYLEATGSGVEAHIEAAAWADVLCVVPATAHVLARLALGLADDFLTTTALAFQGPIVVAPAMHSAMWEKEAVQAHVATLSGRGVRFVGPASGALASGEVGMGRMAEPDAIVAATLAARAAGPLAGRTVLVTAGPTHEPLDPVRYLGNRSSGKMGFALAQEAARMGARTVLVAGPVALATPPGVERIDVLTALEMEREVRRHAPAADLIVMAAAVADYRPRSAAPEKLKKAQGIPAFELIENPDILAGLRDLAPRATSVG